jgi:AcrR family transcriptional regulator
VGRTGVRSPNRRVGAEESRTRSLIVQVADTLLDEEGLAAITTSRIADVVGLKRPIVHYYFRTIEDLIVAILRRREEMVVQILEEALRSEQPLSVFQTVSDPKAAAAIHDMSAFALRSETIRAVGRKFLETVMSLHTQALETELTRRGVKAKTPPAAVAIFVSAVQQAIAANRTLGISVAQPELNGLVRSMLDVYVSTGDLFPNAKARKATPHDGKRRSRSRA